MADGPTASETLGIIGVELYRLEVATESAINLVFAVVQTDWKWMAWYVFWDIEGFTDKFFYAWSKPDARRGAGLFGQGFGRTHHEFHRVFLHLSTAMSVDGLLGDASGLVPANIFVRNALKDGRVLVDVDIERRDWRLHIRRLVLEGNIPEGVNRRGSFNEMIKWGGPGIRGQIQKIGLAKPFDKKELANPPVNDRKAFRVFP